MAKNKNKTKSKSVLQKSSSPSLARKSTPTTTTTTTDQKKDRSAITTSATTPAALANYDADRSSGVESSDVGGDDTTHTRGADYNDDEDDDDDSSEDEMVLAEDAGWGEIDEDEDEDEDEDDENNNDEAKKKKKKKKRPASDPPSAPYEFLLEEMGPHFTTSIRTLLSTSPMYSSYSLAEAVTDQVSVGTVVAQPVAAAGADKKGGSKKQKYEVDMSEDPNNRGVFSFGTLLNLEDEEVSAPISKILTLLKSSCPPSTLPSFSRHLTSTTGLLLTLGLINVPHSITASLLQALIADVEWARENATGEGGAERDLYKFSHVLVASAVDGEKRSGPNSKAFRKAGRWSVPELRRVEDEFILCSSVTEPFELEVKAKSLVTGEVKTQKYAVGVVEWSKFVAGVEEFASMV